MIDHDFGVKLGPIEREDLNIIRIWRNDYRVWRWTRQNDVIGPISHEHWFERQCQDPSIKMYAVNGKGELDGVLVGVCGLTSIDLYNRRAEFSLYIAPDYTKRGLGEAALKTLFTHGFKTLNLNCIWGETFETNPAENLFEKIGMTKEGSRREFYYREGRYWDAHLYSVLASEFTPKLRARDISRDELEKFVAGDTRLKPGFTTVASFHPEGTGTFSLPTGE